MSINFNGELMNYLYARLHLVYAFILRNATAGAVWWILTEGDLSSWPVGLTSVLFCSVLSLYLSPPKSHNVNVVAMMKFMGYFLFASVVAGIDIAKKTVSKQLKIRSVMIEFNTPFQGLPLWVFMISMSLLPGTLSISTTKHGLKIHCLDTEEKIISELIRLETFIARIFYLQPPKRVSK